MTKHTAEPTVYPIGVPLPTISATSPDELLIEALRRSTGLLEQVGDQGCRAWDAIAYIPGGATMRRALRLDEHWNACRDAITRARATGARHTMLRIALDVRDVIAPIAVEVGNLSHPDNHFLCGSDDMTWNSSDFRARRRTLMMRFPGLAAWQIRLDEQDVVAAEAARVTQEQVVRAHQAAVAALRVDKATELLRGLAGKGIVLSSSSKGIAAHPSVLLSPVDRAAVIEHRLELATLLSHSTEMVA